MSLEVRIPQSLIGSGSIAFETLCSTQLLLQKQKNKLITVLNNTARALAVAHYKEPPKGTLTKVIKELDVITGDVIYVLTYSSHEPTRMQQDDPDRGGSL